MSYAVVDSLEAKGLLFQWCKGDPLLRITVNSVTIALNDRDLDTMLNFLEGRYPLKEENEG